MKPKQDVAMFSIALAVVTAVVIWGACFLKEAIRQQDKAMNNPKHIQYEKR